MNKETIRRIRVRKINPFLQSNGIILKKNLFIFLFLVFEMFLTIVIYIDYKMFSYSHLDYLECFNQVGGDVFIINRFLILHFIDNFFIGTWNSYLSDINNLKTSIPYIKEYINYNNFTFTFLGIFEIVLRIIFTFFFSLLILLQIRDQQKFRELGLHSIYSPLILIIFSKYYKQYYFIKTVKGVRVDNLTQEKKKRLIELLFNKDKIFIDTETEQIELKKETLSIFFGFYNFSRYYIEKKSQKK